jgi:hypothetical protein
MSPRGTGLPSRHVCLHGEFWRVSGPCTLALSTTALPIRPGEFHPEPLTEPDLTLSRHPARATARRLPPSIEHRVDPSQMAIRPHFEDKAVLQRCATQVSKPCFDLRIDEACVDLLVRFVHYLRAPTPYHWLAS